MNYKPNIIMDVTFNLFTEDDIHIFHTGKVLTPDKDSIVGLYTFEFDMPPYYLNTGKYRFEIFFGESQKYVLWGNYNHVFQIENTLTGQGYNMATLPGSLKPKFDYKFSCQPLYL